MQTNTNNFLLSLPITIMFDLPTIIRMNNEASKKAQEKRNKIYEDECKKRGQACKPPKDTE